MKTGSLLFALSLLACQALAQDAGAPGRWNEITGEKLLALRLAGDAQRGEAAFHGCQGCHRKGATGSPSGVYPRLAGQHRTVLIEQMADIRSGRRSNEKMLPFADEHAITPQDMADIAVYLERLPVPRSLGNGAGNDLARGSSLYAKDCARCHGARGEGDAGRFYPQVASQHYGYLLREMELIRDGRRGNANPEMVAAIRAYSDADLAAVADHVSRIPAGN